VPHAQANLAKIPDELADEQEVLLADIASTGISAAESADLQIGDSVAVFALIVETVLGSDNHPTSLICDPGHKVL
jgi:hypothetical protein